VSLYKYQATAIYAVTPARLMFPMQRIDADIYSLDNTKVNAESWQARWLSFKLILVAKRSCMACEIKELVRFLSDQTL